MRIFFEENPLQRRIISLRETEQKSMPKEAPFFILSPSSRHQQKGKIIGTHLSFPPSLTTHKEGRGKKGKWGGEASSSHSRKNSANLPLSLSLRCELSSPNFFLFSASCLFPAAALSLFPPPSSAQKKPLEGITRVGRDLMFSPRLTKFPTKRKREQ